MAELDVNALVAKAKADAAAAEKASAEAKAKAEANKAATAKANSIQTTANNKFDYANSLKGSGNANQIIRLGEFLKKERKSVEFEFGLGI